MLNIQQLIDW